MASIASIFFRKNLSEVRSTHIFSLAVDVFDDVNGGRTFSSSFFFQYNEHQK